MSEQHPQERSAAERPSGITAGDALEYSLLLEIEKLKLEREWDANGRNSKTLIKHPDLRIILTVMKRNTRLQEHRTEGRISIQTISGKIRIHASGEKFELASGQLLALDRSVPHDVEALEDSAFLITIAWREKDAPR